MTRTRAILAAVVVVAAARSAVACGYGGPSPAARLALADFVVVGKITAVEPRKLQLALRPTGALAEYTVNVIRIETVVKGDPRITHLRLALGQHQVMPVGYEGCFFLTAHADEPVYTYSTPMFDYPIQKANNPGFAAQVERFKLQARLLDDPFEGLTSDKADERFLTAALLVANSREMMEESPVSGKTEPMDPKLSRLVLKTLAECDWNTTRAADFRLTPVRVFRLLGVTPADGWNPQAPDHVAEAKRWLTDNQHTFRIQTFVRK